MTDIGKVISKELVQYITELKAGKIVDNEVFWPNLQQFDTFFFNKNIQGQEHCEATRVKLNGLLVDDKGFVSYISNLSKKEFVTVTYSTIPDIDGDGKPEISADYDLEPKQPPPFLPTGALCFISSWGVVEYVYQPFLSVIHFSGGGYAIISSMAYLVKAKLLTPPLLP